MRWFQILPSHVNTYYCLSYFSYLSGYKVVSLCGWLLNFWRVVKATTLVVQLVNNLSTMWESRVRSLGQEDPLEKEMATHSSVLAWRIPWTEAPGQLQSMRLQRVRHNWLTNTFTFSSKQQTKTKTIEQKLYAICRPCFCLDFYRKGLHTLRLKYSKLSIEFKRKKVQISGI